MQTQAHTMETFVRMYCDTRELWSETPNNETESAARQFRLNDWTRDLPIEELITLIEDRLLIGVGDIDVTQFLRREYEKRMSTFLSRLETLAVNEQIELTEERLIRCPDTSRVPMETAYNLIFARWCALCLDRLDPSSRAVALIERFSSGPHLTLIKVVEKLDSLIVENDLSPEALHAILAEGEPLLQMLSSESRASLTSQVCRTNASS